jgi:hypothetical protein
LLIVALIIITLTLFQCFEDHRYFLHKLIYDLDLEGDFIIM